MTQTIRTNHFTSLAKQKGAALIIGLVLLISLTIIGIGVLSTTSLEQRMAGNMTDLNLAFNAAETAGRAFAARVRNNPNLEDMTAICQGFSGCYPRPRSDALGKNWWDTADSSWWNSKADILDSRLIGAPLKGVKNQPKMVVELLNTTPVSPVKGFKTAESIAYMAVTTRGTGASDETEVVIQQIISKRQ